MDVGCDWTDHRPTAPPARLFFGSERRGCRIRVPLVEAAGVAARRKFEPPCAQHTHALALARTLRPEARPDAIPPSLADGRWGARR